MLFCCDRSCISLIIFLFDVLSIGMVDMQIAFAIWHRMSGFTNI